MSFFTTMVDPQNEPVAEPTESSPAKVGRPRRGTEAARSDTLLNAATRVFLRDGYGAASIDKVAHEAGVSTRTIYERFKNKADLLTSVITRLVDQDMATLFATTELDRMEVGKALLTIGQTITGRACAPEAAAVFRIVAAEAQRFPALATKMRAATKAPRGHWAIANYFRGQMARGTLCLNDPDRARGVVWTDGLRRAARMPVVRLAGRDRETGLRRSLESCRRYFPERRSAAAAVMMRRFKSSAAGLMLVLGLVSCAVGPNFKAPPAPANGGFTAGGHHPRALDRGGADSGRRCAALRRWTRHPRSVVDAVSILRAQRADRARAQAKSDARVCAGGAAAGERKRRGAARRAVSERIRDLRSSTQSKHPGRVWPAGIRGVICTA